MAWPNTGVDIPSVQIVKNTAMRVSMNAIFNLWRARAVNALGVMEKTLLRVQNVH